MATVSHYHTPVSSISVCLEGNIATIKLIKLTTDIHWIGREETNDWSLIFFHAAPFLKVEFV